MALTNAGDRGLVSAEVEGDCTTPPAALEFEHVPVRDRRVGRVVCPPGTTDPDAAVSTWIDT